MAKMKFLRKWLPRLVLSQAKAQPKGPEEVKKFLEWMFDGDVHAKQVLSLANGVVGIMHSTAASIHAIGRGLAAATGKNPKNTTKQVDRLLSNANVKVWELFEHWVPFVLAARKEIVTALDWTEFDKDDQSTIALHLITDHGRSTPLMWRTVRKSELKGMRARYEDELIDRFHEIVPDDVRVTVLADRGFGDQLRYQHLELLGWDYVIRFRQGITVGGRDGHIAPAKDWLHPSGRARMIRGAKVTTKQTPIPAFVCVHAKGMKDSWCLATSRDDLKASEVVKLYGKRFTIEEGFRDTKDLRFGLGLSATRIRKPARRDRLLLIIAFTIALLTLLGAAAESIGLDRKLKVNTSKKRTHSLFRQGCFWYSAIPNMPEERLRRLMEAFHRVMMEHIVFKEVFGIL